MKKTTSILRTSFVLILAVTLLFLSGEHVKAEDSPVAMEKKIEFLKSIGTTDEVLSFYSDQQINDLYDRLFGQDVSFSGSYSEIVEVKEKVNGERADNIPPSKLKLSVATYNLHSNGKVVGIDVTLGYNWLKKPVFHLHDALSFSWDKSVFYDDGFFASASCNIVGGHPILLKNIEAPAEATDGGIGWYTSLADPIHGMAETYYGGAQILLRPRTPFVESEVLNSKMYLNYAHQYPGISISFGISKAGPSGAITFTSGNYSKQTLSYTYH